MNLERLRTLKLPSIVQTYTAKDLILYALGVGYGDRPDDPNQLQFLYEKDLKAVPSACMVLAHPGFWVSEPSLGIDWLQILHGEQAIEIKTPLPAEGSVRGEYDITCVEDKGAEKGAVMHVTKSLFDAVTGELLAIVGSTYILRGDGGQGGFGVAPPPPDAISDAARGLTCDLKILPQAALIYRLSGDFNPIHADPAAAARAGFSSPILHGLCSMGMATRALIATVANNDPARLRAVSVRFSKPVFPGETLRMEIFDDVGAIRFRARAVERDTIVLDRGRATVVATGQ